MTLTRSLRLSDGSAVDTWSSVGEALAGVGVEHVHVLCGSVVTWIVSPLCTASRPADPDDDVVGRALDAAGAVDERVGAELLDHGDLDRQAALALARPGATPPGGRRR